MTSLVVGGGRCGEGVGRSRQRLLQEAVRQPDPSALTTLCTDKSLARAWTVTVSAGSSLILARRLLLWTAGLSSPRTCWPTCMTSPSSSRRIGCRRLGEHNHLQTRSLLAGLPCSAAQSTHLQTTGCVLTRTADVPQPAVVERHEHLPDGARGGYGRDCVGAV